jgi:hypothetical protein
MTITSQPVYDGPGGLEVQALSLDGLAQYRVRRHGAVMLWNEPCYQGAGGRNPRTLDELSDLVDTGSLTERLAA